MATIERSTSAAKRTHDHDTIREWVESRGGTPSIVESTWDGHSGLLRVDFDEQEEALAEISWEEFFRIFDENELDFLYHDESESRFNEFVGRE
ncbi:MAG TPA: hypothetical protein VGE31_01845 [Candidatus Paceibacterota bacterium]